MGDEDDVKREMYDVKWTVTYETIVYIESMDSIMQ